MSVLSRSVFAAAVAFALLAGGCDDKPDRSAAPEAATAVPTAPEVADPADWCAGHAIPESMCTQCNPELVDKFKAAGDWCEAHGYPESACPSCNPIAPPGAKASAKGYDHDHDGAHVRQGDASDWCAGHAIPESMCTHCNPELVDKFKAAGDWCEAHGYPESACPSCNPMRPPGAEPAQHEDAHAHRGDPADWCGGHGLPESMCTKCNPELIDTFKASGDWCAEHGYPESACPSCNPMKPPPGVAAPSPIAPGTVIRFRTPDIERAAGIETTEATSAELGVGVEAMAQIDFNRNSIAEVRSAIPGIVREMKVDLGQGVAATDELFVLESADVGDLQARRRSAREHIRAARANLVRNNELAEGGIASKREVELARAELRAAQAELGSIDQPLRISGASQEERTGRFAVHSPIAGTVIRRPAVIGTFAAQADSLATVVDTSSMWVLLQIPEWDAASVRPGQRVEVRVDGLAGRSFSGNLTWVASEVDSRTRTVQARAEVGNADGLLRAGQFARVTVRVAAPANATTVPLGAVQRLGDASVVFVRTSEGVYEPRAVDPGRSDGKRVQIGGDVHAGDRVVTIGAFLLRTELSRESIGAGCCEVEGPGAN